MTTEVPQKVIRASADKSNDVLEVTLQHIYSDETYDLGEDPGLIKDGVEDHLQKYLAEQIERIGEGATLVRREYPTGHRTGRHYGHRRQWQACCHRNQT